MSVARTSWVEKLALELRKHSGSPVFRDAYERARAEGMTEYAACRVALQAKRRMTRRRLDLHWDDPKFKQRHAWATRARKAHWKADRGDTLSATDYAYMTWYERERVARKVRDPAAQETARERNRAWLLDQPGIYF